MDRPTPAWLRYYSRCSCGSPVADHAYELTSADGRRHEGRTDRFGMVLLRDLDAAAIHFGPSQRERKRAYPFIAGSPGTRVEVLRALAADSPNDVLTALLDLRRQPLPAAKARLIALLEHANPVVWRNAAITLSAYPDGAADAMMALGPPPRDEAGMLRHLTIHGALRHPEAIGWLARQLRQGSPAVRAISAWAIGFIAHPRGLAALERAASDAEATVRAEVALALGRVGGEQALAAVETLLGDDNLLVASRAVEATAMIRF